MLARVMSVAPINWVYSGFHAQCIPQLFGRKKENLGLSALSTASLSPPLSELQGSAYTVNGEVRASRDR